MSPEVYICEKAPPANTMPQYLFIGSVFCPWCGEKLASHKTVEKEDECPSA